MPLLFIEYPKCTTCQRAKKWLEARGVGFQARHIVEAPPTREELAAIRTYTLQIDRMLQKIWASCGVILVDFKVEFGRLPDGTIVLADEISPDTCRLWDAQTREKLDKDRFRRDMGGVEEAYCQVMERLRNSL